MSAKFRKLDPTMTRPGNKPLHPDDVEMIYKMFEHFADMDCAESLGGNPKLAKAFKRICKKFIKNEITIDELREELEDACD